MQSVSDAFKTAFAATVRDPTHVVELLEYSGYNYPQGVTVTASATSVKTSDDGLFDAANLTEGLSAEPARYAVCDQGARCDQGYRASGKGRLYNLGWWTAIKSNASGIFTSPPMAQLDYSPAISCNRLRVTTSNAYPGVKRVNVKVKYEGAGSYTDLGYLDFPNDGDLPSCRQSITIQEGLEPLSVESVQCYINSTWSGTSYGRILEVEPLLEWSEETAADLTDYCSQIAVTKSCGSAEALKPASPAVGVNSVRFLLSESAGVVPRRNQIVRVKMGYDGENVSQGYFILGPPVKTPRGYDVTGFSRLGMASRFPFPNSVFEGRSVSAIVGQALSWLGINPDDITFSLDVDKVWDWFVVYDTKTGQALQDMARQFLLAIYETEDGLMNVRDQYEEEAVVTITDDMIADYGSTKAEEINQVRVHYGALARGKRDLVLNDSGEVAASATKSFVFRMSRGPCVDTTSPYIDAFQDAENNDLVLPSITEWSADAQTVNVTVQSTAAVDGRFAIKMYGYPLARGEQEAVYTAEDSESILVRGASVVDIPIYATEESDAQLVAEGQLQYLQNCGAGLSLTLNRLASHLQLHDVVHVDSTRADADADYIVNEIRLDIRSGITELVLIPREAV